MKTYLDCISCFIRQPLEAARMATNDEKVHAKVIKEVLNYLQDVSFENTPPESSKDIQIIVKRITGCKDPYGEVKKRSNNMVEEMYPRLEKSVRDAKDPLLEAIRLAIIGNVIDFGSVSRFDVNEILCDSRNHAFEYESYSHFKSVLDKAESILYLADNAGEVVFDRLLLTELSKRGKEVIYAVKENPILNDATFEDAKRARIGKFAKIISADAGQSDSTPGVLLKFASEEFLRYFDSVDMIISKGQGNYESLSDVQREMFFMLVVKCPLVSQDIGSKVGSLVLKAI